MRTPSRSSVAVLSAILVLAMLPASAARVALYQFATANNLETFADQGLTALKWPTPWAEIESAVASVYRAANASENAAPRRFSDEELVAIAASTLADPNGCPGHLVELISQLNAFADYSRTLDAGDDGLMEDIHVGTTQARARLERALEALAMAEGLIASPEPAASVSGITTK